MTAEVAARATEPFFSTKPLGKGTGLGLAQVYGIVRQSGGTLRIESREGEGTIVRLLLPHAERDARRRPRRRAAQRRRGRARRRRRAHLRGRRRRGRARIPRRRRWSASATGSRRWPAARRRWRRSAEGAPDLVLVDFAMPGMNGAELAREVRARLPGPADRLRHRLRRERPARRRAAAPTCRCFASRSGSTSCRAMVAAQRRRRHGLESRQSSS